MKIKRDGDIIEIDRGGIEDIVPKFEETQNKIFIEEIFFSGSSLRFIIPIAALAKPDNNIPIIIVRGTERLRERPIEPLVRALVDLGVVCRIEDDNGIKDKLIVVEPNGKKGGLVKLRGDISSQFVTGILLACPRFEIDTEIIITTDIESKPYINLTLSVLKDFGIQVDVSPDMKHYKIPANQKFKSRNFNVEGDFSSAAFLLAAGAINGDITVKGLNLNSAQGDKLIVNILERMGAKLQINEDEINVKKSKLKGIKINLKDTPDLGPICAVLGCFAEGKTIISGAERLKIKESDRLTAITKELKKMGAQIEPTEDGLIIFGQKKLKGSNNIFPHCDHRIAMSCAIAALNSEGKTIILDSDCVNKSYPSFFDDLKGLGADLSYITDQAQSPM